VQQGDQAFAIGVQEAVIAGAAEAARQHVLHDQPEEVGTGQGTALPACGRGLAVAERYVGVVAGEDVLLADHPAIEVAAEVDQRLGAAANRLAVDHPLRGVGTRQGQPGGGQGGEQLGPEHLGQGLGVEQVGAVLAAPLAAPAFLAGIEGGSRDDQVYVRVVVPIAFAQRYLTPKHHRIMMR